MSCGRVPKVTEIRFQNLGAQLLPPHLAFRFPEIAHLEINLGQAIRYQFQGDDSTDSIVYMTGGGLQSLEGYGRDSRAGMRVFVGTANLVGVLLDAAVTVPPYLPTSWTGPLELQIPWKAHHPLVPVPPQKATLKGTLRGLGRDSLEGTTLTAFLEGEAIVGCACGVQTLEFVAGSIRLRVV